jgi:hypothetical protein
MTDDGFVFSVHWHASKIDGEYSASTDNIVSFVKQPDQALIPYTELTEAQVVGWVKEALGTNGLAAVDHHLKNKISEQKAPTTQSGCPWK